MHLGVYQLTFLARLDLISTAANPQFERYKAEDDPLFHEYLKKSLPDNLAKLSTDRSKIIERIENYSENELEQKGHHPKFGWLTINQWAEFFLLHEAHHLLTIYQLIGSFRLSEE